jgi:hypothetical protein
MIILNLGRLSGAHTTITIKGGVDTGTAHVTDRRGSGGSSGGNGKRKVAILVSGAMRTISECSNTLLTQVIHSNPALDFELFAFLTVNVVTQEDLMQAQARADESLLNFNVREMQVQLDSMVERTVMEKLPGIKYSPEGWGSAKGKAMNVAKMFYGLAKTEELRQNALVKGGDPHFLVMRVRPDLCICDALKLEHLDTSVVYLPWYTGSLAFDQLAVGPPHLMSTYAAAFDTTITTLVERGDKFLHPELVLREHLQAHNVPLKMLANFRASLARITNGMQNDAVGVERVYMIDPFEKLRKDFPHVSVPAPMVCLT